MNVNATNPLVHSPFFKTNILKVEGHLSRDYSQLDSFVIYISLTGTAKIVVENETYTLQKGETILLPATLNTIEIEAENTEIIEVYM